jgi:hypothetical protein
VQIASPIPYALYHLDLNGNDEDPKALMKLKLDRFLDDTVRIAGCEII